MGVLGGEAPRSMKKADPRSFISDLPEHSHPRTAHSLTEFLASHRVLDGSWAEPVVHLRGIRAEDERSVILVSARVGLAVFPEISPRPEINFLH